MLGFGESRDWGKEDEYNDRRVTETAVPEENLGDDTTTVDAVPGCCRN